MSISKQTAAIYFYLSSSMLNPTGSTTSISEASTQMRYHKAIKEISKLIGANAMLKKQIEWLREENQRLSYQCQVLANASDQTKQEKISLLSTVQQQSRQIESKLAEIANLERKYNEKAIQSLDQDIKVYTQQIAVLNEKLYQQGNTIIGLEENIGQLQKMNKNLAKEKDEIQKSFAKKMQIKQLTEKQCLGCKRLSSKLDQSESHLRLIENELVQLKKFHIMTDKSNGQMKYRGVKDGLVSALEQRIRILDEKGKRKNIQIYKLKQCMQNFQKEKQQKTKIKSCECQQK